MDINECYRVLELETGASHEAVEAAFHRLLEHWSPDRAAAGGPDAVREAQRRVQAITDAHRTLVQAPDFPKPPTTGSAPTGATKPTLRPLAAVQPPVRPPVRPPVPENPPPRPAPPASAPFPAPQAVAPAPALPVVPPAPAPEPGAYARLFPAGSPQRRFAPVILAAALILVLLLGKSVFSSSGTKRAGTRGPDPQTTGGLVVKANRAEATVEATRTPAGGEAPAASVTGTAGQTLTGLRPGKYALTVRAAGWPDLSQEVTVDAARTTELAVSFPSGSLRLDSDPSGAAVRWGTEVLGRTPLLIPQLPPGECRLSLEYPFWPAVIVKTTITENGEAAATVRLPHGKLTVESSPAGATVLLGGRTVGQTPLTMDPVPAGPKKLTLQSKDFPPLELTVTVEDGREAKVSPSLAAAFPALDAERILRDVWVPNDPDKIAPPNDGMSGPSAPRNDIVRNLNRKRLYEYWMRKSYCLTAVVKSYDRASGLVEFAEERSELSKYRVLAKLGPEAYKDKELAARLTKGAPFALYGRLTAVEEPRWPFRVITFELSGAEPLR